MDIVKYYLVLHEVRKKYDKRQALKEKAVKRDVARDMKARY